MYNFAQDLIETYLPYIISLCELIGIFIVVVTVARSFYRYLKALLTNSSDSSVKFQLASGLATSLSFKMAGELLKTVIVHNMQELMVLGVIILLRALLAVLIHYEIEQERRDQKTEAAAAVTPAPAPEPASPPAHVVEAEHLFGASEPMMK